MKAREVRFMTKGEKIRLYRTKKQITQKALAELAGVSEVAIKKYESGERNPKPEQIKKIATALQIDEYALLDIEIDHLSVTTVEDVISLISLLDQKVGIAFNYKINSLGSIDPSSITLKFTDSIVNIEIMKWLTEKGNAEKLVNKLHQPDHCKETLYSTYSTYGSEDHYLSEEKQKYGETKKNKTSTNSDK